MARPLSDSYRGGTNGGYASNGRYAQEDRHHDRDAAEDLRSENAQLRQLCVELEQALQEATSNIPDVVPFEERIRECEGLLEEKSGTIRQLHLQLEEAQENIAALSGPRGSSQGTSRRPAMPAEDELLQLSEDLEREKRQLQEDEQSLMEQMRQMEMSMARERAEMARQRNDLQRLYGDIRHELERLERNGALQSKMDELRTRLQDATNRRGAAPGAEARPASTAQLPAVGANQPVQPSPAKGSFIGRLFGSGGGDK